MWFEVFVTVACAIGFTTVLAIPISLWAKRTVEWPRPWGASAFFAGLILYTAALVATLFTLADRFGLLAS